MLKEKTIEETKEFVDSITADLEKVIEERKSKMSDKIALRPEANIDDLNKLTVSELYYYIQCLQAENNQLTRLLKHYRSHADRLFEQDEVWRAQKIIRHWNLFNKHLDENPSVREEWDSLCMAIKLTEED